MLDFRTSNLLLQLQSLDGSDEEQVLDLLGEREKTDIGIRQDSRPTPIFTCAPKHLAYPVDFQDVQPYLILKSAYITDLGGHLTYLSNRCLQLLVSL